MAKRGEEISNLIRLDVETQKVDVGELTAAEGALNSLLATMQKLETAAARPLTIRAGVAGAGAVGAARGMGRLPLMAGLVGGPAATGEIKRLGMVNAAHAEAILKVQSLTRAKGNLNAEMMKFTKMLGTAAPPLARHAVLMDELRTRAFGFIKIIGKVALWTVATGAVFGFIRSLTRLLSVIKEVDTASAQMAKILDQPIAALGRMRNELAKLSAEYGANVAITMEAATMFARAGLRNTEIVDASRVALLAANVAELEGAEAVGFLTAATVQFGKDMTEMNIVLDEWNELSNLNKVTTRDLADAVSMAGAVFKEAGASIEDLNAYTTALAVSTNKSGRIIGTALKTIGSYVYRTQTMAKVQRLTGIEIKKATGQLMDLDEVLGRIAMKWDFLTEAERNELAQSIAGVRQKNFLLGIMNNYTRVMTAQVQQYGALGSAEEENKILAESLGKTYERMEAQFRRLAIATGDAGLRGAMVLLVDTTGKLVKVVADSGAAGGAMAVWLAAVTLHMVALKVATIQTTAATGILTRAIIGLAGALTTMNLAAATKNFHALGLAIAATGKKLLAFALAHPVIIGVTAIIAVVVLLRRNVRELGEEAREAADKIAEAFEELEERLGRFNVRAKHARRFFEWLQQLEEARARGVEPAGAAEKELQVRIDLANILGVSVAELKDMERTEERILKLERQRGEMQEEVRGALLRRLAARKKELAEVNQELREFGEQPFMRVLIRGQFRLGPLPKQIETAVDKAEELGKIIAELEALLREPTVEALPLIPKAEEDIKALEKRIKSAMDLWIRFAALTRAPGVTPEIARLDVLVRAKRLMEEQLESGEKLSSQQREALENAIKALDIEGAIGEAKFAQVKAAIELDMAEEKRRRGLVQEWALMTRAEKMRFLLQKQRIEWVMREWRAGRIPTAQVGEAMGARARGAFRGEAFRAEREEIFGPREAAPRDVMTREQAELIGRHVALGLQRTVVKAEMDIDLKLEIERQFTETFAEVMQPQIQRAMESVLRDYSQRIDAAGETARKSISDGAARLTGAAEYMGE